MLYTTCRTAGRRSVQSLKLFRRHYSSTSSMQTVLVTRKVPERGVNVLKEAGVTITQWDDSQPIPRSELLEKIKGVNGLFCTLTDKIDSEVLDSAGSQLKVVGTMSVGFDHVELSECWKRNIRVGFTPNVLTYATAELTVSLLLATTRRLQEGIRAAKDGSWGAWNPLWLCGSSLQNRTVGIFGFGRIGQKVQQMLSGFEVGEFLYCNKHEVSGTAAKQVDFSELLEKSDYVICCCSFTKETENIFNSSSLSKMKKNAVLINTSRGGVVNMDDLAAALEQGQIGAAGLDVTVPEPFPLDHKLQKLDNCVILPHIASATTETRSAMSELTGRNIIAALNNQDMESEVKP